MSQSQFATVFGVSVGTLRGWEQRRRVPEGPAQVLLAVIDREPEAVLRALHYDQTPPKMSLEERAG
jgi:putative transcriptional regulator